MVAFHAWTNNVNVLDVCRIAPGYLLKSCVPSQNQASIQKMCIILHLTRRICACLCTVCVPHGVSAGQLVSFHVARALLCSHSPYISFQSAENYFGFERFRHLFSRFTLTSGKIWKPGRNSESFRFRSGVGNTMHQTATHTDSPRQVRAGRQFMAAVAVLALALLVLPMSVSTLVFLHGVEPPCCQSGSGSQPLTSPGDCADSSCGFLSWFLSFLPESTTMVHAASHSGGRPWAVVQPPPDPLLHPAEFPPEPV